MTETGPFGLKTNYTHARHVDDSHNIPIPHASKHLIVGVTAGIVAPLLAVALIVTKKHKK